MKRGDTFQNLRVHSLLGKGGMGEAWLVSHPVLRTPLVVKRFSRLEDPEIFREAHLAARVRSPHAVEVTDAGWARGEAYVVQRYVDGIDLDELRKRMVRSGRPLPAGVVARVIADAARGLHAVHQTVVIHRDVKPANLFLDGAGRCSVGDFGIAVDVNRNSAEHGPTRGTPLFMAPEQWTQDQVDRRTDLYALGATAHLLATGTPPFTGQSYLDVANAHLERAYDRPLGDNPEAAYLFAVVERMLAKDKANRHANAEVVARLLEHVAAPRPAVAAGGDGARVGPIRVQLEVGDLAMAEADVLVSAANADLTMEFNVAKALKARGGDAIEREARTHGPVAMGDVVWTGAGTLDATWVAHAVGALDGAVCLQRATLRTLLEAEARGARSVVFPALGTGIGDVPMAQGASLMLEAARTFAWLGPRSVRQVRFRLLTDAARAAWHDVMHGM